MTDYIDEISGLTKQPPIVEMINDRVNAYKIIGTLKKIMELGVKNSHMNECSV